MKILHITLPECMRGENTTMYQRGNYSPVVCVRFIEINHFYAGKYLVYAMVLV
jgi:hypothetical protein